MTYTIGSDFAYGYGNYDAPTGLPGISIEAHKGWAEFSYGPCFIFNPGSSSSLASVLAAAGIVGVDATNVADMVDNKLIADARCNKSTPTIGQTTSRSDATDRFQAALGMFTQIAAKHAVAGAASAIDAGKGIGLGGYLVPTFTATFADGGSERFEVIPSKPPTLYIEGNLPGSLVDGGGTAKPCPVVPTA